MLKGRSTQETTHRKEEDLMMTPEVPADEAVTDPVVASEEEPRDSGMTPESPTADLPQDSNEFEPSLDANVSDDSDEFMEEESVPPFFEDDFGISEGSPLLPSESEQGMSEVDPEVGTPITGFDTVEEIPRAEIPSPTPTASVGKSSFVFLPTGPDTSSGPTERGESSSGPSLHFAKKVLVRVLSSWIETLLSGHLDAGFGMIQRVKEILTDTEEVGLDVTGARAIVDRVIALGDRWFETKDFPDDRFFKEMSADPIMKAESDIDEATQSKKQVVRERNLEELAILGLNHDLVILEGEVEEAKKHLENLKVQVAAKWAAVVEARNRETILIRRVADAEQVLQLKIEEREKWQTLWSKLPGVEE